MTTEAVEIVLPGIVEPEGLRVARRRLAAAGPGQVRIRMEATGVSFAEQQMRGASTTTSRRSRSCPVTTWSGPSPRSVRASTRP